MPLLPEVLIDAVRRVRCSSYDGGAPPMPMEWCSFSAFAEVPLATCAAARPYRSFCCRSCLGATDTIATAGSGFCSGFSRCLKILFTAWHTCDINERDRLAHDERPIPILVLATIGGDEDIRQGTNKKEGKTFLGGACPYPSL